MDGLTDGIRLRRATNTTGTTWQEVRMRVKTFGAWSWAFGGGIYLSSIKFDNTTTNLATSTYRTNTTANVQVANDTRRVFTYPLAAHNLRSGFSFGANVTNGSASATSYLWEFANENSAIPFTQVFVRPTISEADIVDDGVSVAPSSGLPASTVDPMLDRRPTPQPWATTGINLGTANPDLSANVLAFADIGNTIYIGGKFLQLQRGPAATPITQSYLAAFDKTTGERIESFNPVIDAPVWELKAAPDGSKLFVGGEFTNVNGVANTGGLAALDPTTGAPLASWVGFVSRTTGTADVRAMDIQNGYLYVGGQFNGVAGGVGAQFTGPIVVGRLARLRVSDGRPDGGWKPNIETAPQDLDASAQGDRVYAVGLFQTLNGVTLNPTKLAIMNTTNGDAVSGLEPWQPNATSSEWVNAILEVGSKVYQGGTQHILHQYTRSDYELERSHLTKTGGDFQAVTYRDGILYASCHCTDWQYQDSNTWSDPINYSRVNAINLIGAYDTTNDLEVVPEFHPTQIDLVGDGGEGPWELFVDSNNCMWAGGDLMRLGTTATPFYGGYERFCGRDATAPTTPGNSKATLNGNDVTLTWNASTDNATAPIRYQILKDDPTFGTIVMGTTFDRTFTDTNVVDSSRYFIRTVDDEGNRSATTAAISVTPPPPAVATLLAHGATWAYQADGQDLGASIHSSSLNTASWATGASQLGWGGKGENTVIPSNPVTSYYVRRVNIANPAQYKTISVRLKRDDGAVVYVNGVPVVRDNMPDGPILATTLASSYTSGAAESTWFEYQVPASLFVAGENTIAAEVHQADANNADGIFDLELVARNSIETTAPTKPTPKVDDVSFGSVALSWTASTDNRAVVGYLVRRNGTPIAFSQGTTVTDIGLAPTTAYTYQVARGRQLRQLLQRGLGRGHHHCQQRPGAVGRHLVLPVDGHRPGYGLAARELRRVGVVRGSKPARVGQPRRSHGRAERDADAVLPASRERDQRRRRRSAHPAGQARRRHRGVPERHRDPARQPAGRPADRGHASHRRGQCRRRDHLEDLHHSEHRPRQRRQRDRGRGTPGLEDRHACRVRPRADDGHHRHHAADRGHEVPLQQRQLPVERLDRGLHRDHRHLRDCGRPRRRPRERPRDDPAIEQPAVLDRHRVAEGIRHDHRDRHHLVGRRAPLDQARPRRHVHGDRVVGRPRRPHLGPPGPDLHLRHGRAHRGQHHDHEQERGDQRQQRHVRRHVRRAPEAGERAGGLGADPRPIQRRDPVRDHRVDQRVPQHRRDRLPRVEPDDPRRWRTRARSC